MSINNDNKMNKKDLVVKIILIIIIIILLLHNCSLIKNNNNIKTPTGNVDIFEIICDENKCEDDDSTPVGGDGTGNGNLEIKDNDITWSSTNNLRIFSNPVYDMKQKIAPESSNIYQFVVNNNTNTDILYRINFLESNIYNINMKYKLKLDNTYIAGDKDTWVSYNELNKKGIQLGKSNSHTYYLEWKWISSENDTKVGSTINAGYNLNIEIKAEQDDE